MWRNPQTGATPVRSRARILTAQLIDILLFYDQPQLILLRSSRDFDMLAVAVRREGMLHPFFGCEIPPRIITRYFNERADLHYAFSNAVGSAYYFLDLSVSDTDQIPLTKATSEEAENVAYWPQIGFFARNHTSAFNMRSFEGESVQIFNIDGNWAASDFSQLHAKLSDLYALFGAVNRLDGDGNEQEFNFIRRSVQERFWQGGGSYVGFYDDLLERAQFARPLEVQRIQYASPGQIAFRGDRDTLAVILQIISVFDGEHDALKAKYTGIYRILRRERLLSATRDAEFSSDAIRNFVRTETFSLARMLGLERSEQIFMACDDNVLIFCKLILSIYRRARDLYAFRAEGRLQL
jgi:hypothetical protein